MAIKKYDLSLGRPQSWAEILREHEYMPAYHILPSAAATVFLRDKLQGEVNSDLPWCSHCFCFDEIRLTTQLLLQLFLFIHIQPLICL